ncbi:hypothetical protein FHS61_000428 [Altererythrobacter atlanticus]|uniref:Uncharacterized protein n=1 Tax=Croceibacterium atlanticum TaxID=1267766 RepID=A0A0F7KQ47_9SPHN|nr:hypothetical protein [Croceibacterium atlanticum]AKH42658.1 hypothetical protein WYH_01622 [Croceibacterium atlanticum]MBB5731435.1 hypothetical protein [Croceibacterium atlanticum]
MKIDSILPYRWRTRRDTARHNEAVARILDTPPIVAKQDGLVLFSMIGTAVLLPYLVAVKSLWQQLGRGRIAILDDGTLTAQDRAILAHHCGDPELIRMDMVERGDFPKGGCWERFLTILDRRSGEYWLQLDSDTVTLGPVPEVERAIATNRSFTLLGDAQAEAGPLPLYQFVQNFYPDGPEEGHVQTVVESRLGRIPPERGWRYLRGCAGFAGFAAGGPGRELARAFLMQITDMAGEEGAATWGTEQVASNFHIANEPSPVLLPYSRYLNYWGEDWAEDAAFIHFVGTHRYSNGAYARASQDAIDRLLPA